jgi:hypothetical protein
MSLFLVKGIITILLGLIDVSYNTTVGLCLELFVKPLTQSEGIFCCVGLQYYLHILLYNNLCH